MFLITALPDIKPLDMLLEPNNLYLAVVEAKA
jgi:hypothetical protein